MSNENSTVINEPRIESSFSFNFIHKINRTVKQSIMDELVKKFNQVFLMRDIY